MKALKLNNTLTKLVTILNDGEFHDGTTLGNQLKITRSAIWKAIKKLESYNIKINSIKGKGYSLVEPLILLNKNNIKKSLTDKNISLDIFETINSTNDYLKTFLNHPTRKICLSEYQTNGKGRLHRTWYSPFGQNIYLSYMYPFQRDVSELAGLSLVVALSVAKTLNSYKLSSPALVKWPNDILCNHQKIAGNLIELEAESNGTCNAIIGIGINVNMISTLKNSISKPWTSLRLLTGEYIDRNKFVVNTINNLTIYLQAFNDHGLAYFLKEWQKMDYLAGKSILLQGITQQTKGTMKGIDAQGHLLLILKNGSTQSFSSGDTSIVD